MSLTCGERPRSTRWRRGGTARSTCSRGGTRRDLPTTMTSCSTAWPSATRPRRRAGGGGPPGEGDDAGSMRNRRLAGPLQKAREEMNEMQLGNHEREGQADPGGECLPSSPWLRREGPSAHPLLRPGARREGPDSVLGPQPVCCERRPHYLPRGAGPLVPLSLFFLVVIFGLAPPWGPARRSRGHPHAECFLPAPSFLSSAQKHV